MIDCEKIKNSLLDFFKNSIKVETDKKECRIVFPIYGRDNDLIEIFIRESSLKEKGKYYITDDAETISTLYGLGVEIEGEGKRKNILDSIEKSLGIEINDGEIRAYAKDDDLGLIISKIISSILGVQYIQYTSKPVPITAFKERVRIFLDEKAPEYRINPKITGISGEPSKFDFGYPQYDIYMDTLHATSVYHANTATLSTCFKSIEITTINAKLKVIAVFDDIDEESKGSWTIRTEHYMKQYLYGSIPWSEKEKLLEIIE